jgi:hypothetical protein
MCYDPASGSMFAYTNWSHVSATGWYSYPSVVYGVNEWNGAHSTNTSQSPAWVLPRSVGSAVNGSLWVVVNYSVHPPNASDTDGYDFSLDDFFTGRQPPVFEVGPFVEVMVWFSHHITYPATFSPFTAPTLVNGTLTDAPWSVADWCHGPDNSTNDNVSFDFSYGGQGTSGLPAGTIGVNLSLFLAHVEQMMPSVSCWEGPTTQFSTFYLDEANLGSEDGALAGSDFNYNWTVHDYCFVTQVRDPGAVDLACPGSIGGPARNGLPRKEF